MVDNKLIYQIVSPLGYGLPPPFYFDPFIYWVLREKGCVFQGLPVLIERFLYGIPFYGKNTQKRRISGYRTPQGKLNGPIRQWFTKPGRIWRIVPYEFGKIYGVVQEFFCSGAPKRIYTSINAKRNGIEVVSNRKGLVLSMCNYKGGKKDGVEVVWRGPFISRVSLFKADTKQGRELIYAGGKLVDKRHYRKNGTLYKKRKS